jgi:hypothetical protein
MKKKDKGKIQQLESFYGTDGRKKGGKKTALQLADLVCGRLR